jgi:hypothetical protein
MSNNESDFCSRNIKKAEKIQAAALNNKLKNGVRYELTLQQALSILFRSRQLKHEGGFHPHLISDTEKVRQIDECYKQRDKQK